MPERLAWETLRRFRMQGFVVRRQHPIGRFIVDFAVVKAKLVVEIDGGVHRLPAVMERDTVRELTIISKGWRVLRIPASAVLHKDYFQALLQKELGL